MSGTFLLGLGVQKSGTTWLHEYLSQSPESDFGFVKEYHIWDLRSQIGLKARKAFMTRFSRRVAQGRLHPGLSGGAMRLAFMSDPEIYFDYFAARLERPGIRLTGDITPTYSLLSGVDLAAIRDGFARRNVRIRAVLLLRDPVQRLRSMFRMNCKAHGKVLSAEEEFSELCARQARGGDDLRSDYVKIVHRARKIFGDDLFVTLYEDLFQDTSIRAICDFCGIAPHPADLDRKVNAGDLPKHFDKQQYRILAAPYLRQMAFITELFGHERMERLWPVLAAEGARVACAEARP